MNQENVGQPMELPKPEDKNSHELVATEADIVTEKSSAQQLEQGNASSQSPQQVVATSNQGTTLPITPNGQDETQTTPPVSYNPQIADDVDLIEKEWVEKAKIIVERTKNDPHQQNIAINKMKADYLQKRYQKDIKVIGE